MRVLLTGGAGFIGHHTLAHLLAITDWEIVILDSLNYAGDPMRVAEVEGFDADRVQILWHDLRAPIGESMDNRIGEIDYAINMASESHVDRSIADPVPFIHNNVMLSLHMLEWARRAKPKKFIQVSTDEVYGPALPHRSHQEWDVLIPSNPYAASKASQEACTIAYWRTFGVPVIITNTMNNFGERQHPEKFIPLAIDHLMRRIPVPVHAKKEMGVWTSGSRVWLHARNHADALVWILNNVAPPSFEDGATRPERLHIAGEFEISNTEMVEFLSRILHVEPLFDFVDFHSSRPGHDLRYSLDGTKLRDLGWLPPFAFESSLVRTVEWYVGKAIYEDLVP